MEQALPFVPYIQAAVPWTAWGPQKPVYPRALPPPARQAYFLPRGYARKAGDDVYDIGLAPTRFFSNEYAGEHTDYSAYTLSGMSDFTSGFVAPRGFWWFGHQNIRYQPQNWVHYGIKGVDQYYKERPMERWTQDPSFAGTGPFHFPQPFPGAPFGTPSFGRGWYDLQQELL